MQFDCVARRWISYLSFYKSMYFQKLSRQTAALEMVKWADQHKKGKAVEILVMDAMSSEESCYENDDNGNSRVVKYAVRNSHGKAGSSGK